MFYDKHGIPDAIKSVTTKLCMKLKIGEKYSKEQWIFEIMEALRVVSKKVYPEKVEFERLLSKILIFNREELDLAVKMTF